MLKKYLLTFKIGIEDTLEYKVDFLFHTLKYAFVVMVMIFVWGTVVKSGSNQIFDSSSIIIYFVFSALLYGLSNFHTWYIEEEIKNGGFARFLLKPVHSFFYYFFFQASTTVLEVITKLMLLPLLLLLGYSLTVNLTQLGLFLLYLPLIFFFSFSLIGCISLSSFWLTEVYSIRWSLLVIFRLFAGILAPLSFFPPLFQKVSFYFPFQHLAYTPIMMLQSLVSVSYALQGFIILFVWSIVVFSLYLFLEHKGQKQYETIGI